MKKVTVYIPSAGNTALEPVITSVLCQSYPNIEIIIVDDSGSNSVVSGVLSKFGDDPRVHVLVNRRNRGACGARNTAIDVASGHFITGIDDDDLMLPNRIQTMVEAWEDSFSLVFCGHYRRFEDRDVAVPIPRSIISPTRILHRNYIGNQVLTRLDYIKGAGMFDEDLPAYQDFDMWVRLMRTYGRAKGVRKLNYIFTQTGASRISSSKARRRSAWLKFVKKHRPWLSVSHRQSLALLAYKEQWKKPSLRTLLAFANCGNLRLVALFLRRRWLGR